MSGDDVFDAFNDDAEDDSTVVKEEPIDEMDQMQRLEAEKQSDSRKRAIAYLEEIIGGDADEAKPEKRARLDAVPPTSSTTPSVAEDSDVVMDFGSNIVHYVIDTPNVNCTHEVAYMSDTPFQELQLRNTEPAKTFPFQLDAFQSEAIKCIENNESVLVSAHTSAGKTVVALYAIAQCLRDKQRVIYTSPIKALSNQKYRELEEEFGDVGLMTGDVTLNPDASCIVMTTEILRSMLYRGSEMMREVGWVVFDEIHYMRDKERGVVWEETIILMSDNVHHVFLSATIPNARQFAEWVCFLHKQPVHVVYTDYRPTPLQHFIYPIGGEGLFEVVNVKGEFREDKFNQAMSGLASMGDKAAGGVRRGRNGGTSGNSNLVKIIRTMKEKDMLPCIIFSFSRKECEANATGLKDMDFSNAEEKASIKEIFSSAVDLLSDDDKKLPQISQLLPLLMRGIGVHHSGLLPILKETVEILFGEGLLRTLFATETFSMGLNMPARTVVFTSARKFDGKDNRWISSGEYIQMSGRAGRRGKDDRGLVILMVDAKMSSDDAKHIIKGATDPLNSQFRLTYNMVLNLLRVDGVTPQFMLEKSFYQFQNYAKIPKLTRELEEKTAAYEKCVVPRETELQGYFQLIKRIELLETAIKKTVMNPRYITPFLHTGRLLKVNCNQRDFGWAVLINFMRKPDPDDDSKLIYVLEVLMCVTTESSGDLTDSSLLRPAMEGFPCCWELVPITLECVDAVSAVRIKLPSVLKSAESRMSVGRAIKTVKERFRDEVPQLDPIEDMKIKDEALTNNMENVKQLKARRDEHSLSKDPQFASLKRQWEEKCSLKELVDSTRREVEKCKSVLHLDELVQRKRVLKRLQYCTTEDTIEAKGRVACELSAADELMLTEMIYGGVFNDLSAGQIAALLSCFVFQDKAQTPKMAQELSGCLRSLQEYARKIAKISNECKLDIVEDNYVESFKPGLMDVVYNWVMGASFSEILKTTDVFEGSIIRCLRRLEEVLREMVNAAKSMENKDLEAKVEDARSKIKRDIVFAASLYL